MESGPSAPHDLAKLARGELPQVFADLGTGPQGLTTLDATRRLDSKGFNVLPPPKKVPLSRKALAQLMNLFNVLLLAAAFLSFVSGSPQMGLAIAAVVVIAVLFSLFQEFRAERAVEALRQLVPENARIMRDGDLKQVPVSHVAPGDVISLEEGDKVPADARLLTAFELDVDNSTLTGESEPVRRSANPPPEGFEGATTDLPNLIFAGTVVASGSASAVVLATGPDTRFGQVVAMAEAVEEPLSPLQRELDHTARVNVYVAVGVGLAFLAFVLVVLHLSVADGVLFMIGVATSLVPEGLQVTVTVALALSSLALSKRNVVVKRLSSVETLGSTTVICTDKTGTITEGQMTVRKVWMGGTVLDVTGEGYEPEGSVVLQGVQIKAIQRPDLKRLAEVAALDNRATLVPPLDRRKSRWTAVGDSTDAALLVLAAKAGVDPKKALAEQPRLGMIPFESARKMMTSVHRDASGRVTAYVKGAGLEILSRSTSVQWADKVVPMTDEAAAVIRRQIDAFSREAYRVIALAVRTLPGEREKYDSEGVERDLTFVGLVAILDPPRADVPKAVYKARSAGLRIIMLTGDHELTAEAIARKVGIVTSSEAAVVTGYRLPKMTDEELSKILDTPEVVFARTTPEQKLRIVRAMKAKGEIVAVTGDGVNDAPALLEADIGVAMGITGTDVARESADMVLLDDNFASIVNGIEVGRSVFDDLRKFVVYVFSHNWAELVAFFAFVLLGAPLPLTVVQILAIDLGLEIPPSLSLTLEPPEPGIMDRPPRPKGSRLFDLGTLARSAYIGNLTGLVALFWCFSIWSQAGWTLGSSTIAGTAYLVGTTAFLVTIMAGQLGNLFATRTNVESTFTLNPLRNKWLLGGLLAELALLVAIVYVPFLQDVFGTAGLAPVDWLYLYSVAPVVIVLEEGRKLVLRRVVLPAKVAPPRPVPLVEAVPEPAGVAAGETPVRLPFIERGPPILVPVFLRPGDESALPIALSLAEYSGSRVVLARIVEEEPDASRWEEFRSRMRVLAEDSDIPWAFVDVRPGRGSMRSRNLAHELERIASQIGAANVVVPAGPEILSGRGGGRALAWINHLRAQRAVLVVGPKPLPAARRGTFRILIPVLEEFHPEPFDVASALTASTRFPSVDVLATKVIRLPPIVPVYSTYRPESLFDEERELAFLKGERLRPLQRLLSPRILVVREVGRDLGDFARERKVDIVLLAGDRKQAHRGFLDREEREIARRSPCATVIVLPAEEGAGTGTATESG